MLGVCLGKGSLCSLNLSEIRVGEDFISGEDDPANGTFFGKSFRAFLKRLQFSSIPYGQGGVQLRLWYLGMFSGRLQVMWCSVHGQGGLLVACSFPSLCAFVLLCVTVGGGAFLVFSRSVPVGALLSQKW